MSSSKKTITPQTIVNVCTACEKWIDRHTKGWDAPHPKVRPAPGKQRRKKGPKVLNKQKAADRPASVAQRTYASTLPLAEKLAETPLDMVTDVFNGALDRRDAKANSGLIKDAVAIMKQGDVISAHEDRMKAIRAAEASKRADECSAPDSVGCPPSEAEIELELARARVAVLEAELRARRGK